jgi:hypothetical protein
VAKEVDEGADASCCCCCDVDGSGAEVASPWVYVVVAADGAMGMEALVLGLDLSRGRVSQLYSLGSRHQPQETHRQYPKRTRWWSLASTVFDVRLTSSREVADGTLRCGRWDGGQHECC